MNLDGSVLVNSYIEWLKSKIKVLEINGFQEISTPFLDRHNDHIQIYVKRDQDKLTLSDDSYIISDLIMSGCDISSDRRKNVLTTILNGFGVRLNKDELIIEATKDNFPQKKHALIQAMISVNDMFMMSSHRVASLFLEDIESFLNLNDIRYTPTIQIVGKSGFSHKFDFVIPPSKKSPERFIRAINNPNRDKATGVLFSWNDVREIRNRETSMYVFLNDAEKAINTEITNAFSEYGVTAIEWSKRNNFVQTLAS